MNDNIITKVNEIVDVIKNSKEYQDYIYLENKLNNNKKVKDLVKKIKVLQKQIVKKEVLKQDTKDLEKQIDEYLSILNKIPLYLEYIEKQNELNRVYQNIKSYLDDYFYNTLN